MYTFQENKLIFKFSVTDPEDAWTKVKDIPAWLGFLTHGIFSYIIGLSGLAMALCVCVPIPGTNSIPSFGIAVMAVGVLMRDGLAVLAGMVIGLLWICLLVFLGAEGISMIKDMILG